MGSTIRLPSLIYRHSTPFSEFGNTIMKDTYLIYWDLLNGWIRKVINFVILFWPKVVFMGNRQSTCKGTLIAHINVHICHRYLRITWLWRERERLHVYWRSYRCIVSKNRVEPSCLSVTCSIVIQTISNNQPTSIYIRNQLCGPWW